MRGALALAALALPHASLAFPAKSGNCKFAFPDRGVEYDLESLRGKVFPFVNKADNKEYRLSLCSNTPGFLCAGIPSAALMLVTPGKSVCGSSYGRAENASVTLLAEDVGAGIRLSFSSGTPCQTGLTTLYSTVNLACDPSMVMPSISAVETIPLCGLDFYISAAQACGKRVTVVNTTPSTGWYAFLGVLGAAAVYLGGGIAYKRSALGANGFEAVPNIDSWRWLYGLTVEPVGNAVWGTHTRAEDYATLGGVDTEDGRQ
jgi:hypothetical protein